MSLNNLIPWFLSSGIKIAAILFIAIVINQLSRTMIKRVLKKSIDFTARVNTMVEVLVKTLRMIVWVLVALMILPEFGINTAPLLAGAGLVGLAVGMASKDIISDFISGLFIILEGQYNIGDKVVISRIEGEVQEISLRRTVIRDSEGTLHFIPNSQVKIISKKNV